MGKQIAICTTAEDEKSILRFLLTLTPFRVFCSHQESKEHVWVDDWESRDLDSIAVGYNIWPTRFEWTPIYDQTGGPGCPPDRAGFWYIAKTGDAPILELVKTDWDKRRPGRLYWSKNFSAPEGLPYDAEEFSKLVDSVWKWIRKVGKHPPEERNTNDRYSMMTDAWALPDAWNKLKTPEGKSR